MNAHGQVVMGMQFHGEPFERVPLLATHEQEQPLRPLYAPDLSRDRWHSMLVRCAMICQANILPLRALEAI